MSKAETKYILNYLRKYPYRNRIEKDMTISQTTIDLEHIPYHKVNYYLLNLDFDNATKCLSNVSNGLYNTMEWKINHSEEFYNKYGICCNKNNEMLISELKNKYMTNMLNTTRCHHDKSGRTMRINCWKCS